MLTRFFSGAAIFGLALAVWPLSGLAHTHLDKSEPEKNAVLSTSPTKVKLEFSGRIEAEFSKIEVMDADGKQVTEGPVTGSENRRELETNLPAGLKPGTYNVKWSVISGDGHRIKGEYDFSIK